MPPVQLIYQGQVDKVVRKLIKLGKDAFINGFIAKLTTDPEGYRQIYAEYLKFIVSQHLKAVACGFKAPVNIQHFLDDRDDVKFMFDALIEAIDIFDGVYNGPKEAPPAKMAIDHDSPMEDLAEMSAVEFMSLLNGGTGLTSIELFMLKTRINQLITSACMLIMNCNLCLPETMENHFIDGIDLDYGILHMRLCVSLKVIRFYNKYRSLPTQTAGYSAAHAQPLPSRKSNLSLQINQLDV